MLKEKVGIIPKSWQVSAIIEMIYNKKDIVISDSTSSSKNLFYQLISLIKDGAIVLVVLSTITLMTDRVCFHLLLLVLEANYFSVNHYSNKELVL